MINSQSKFCIAMWPNSLNLTTCNPTKLWFSLFLDFYCWAWVFIAKENIACTLKWTSVKAKNGKNICFSKKKVWLLVNFFSERTFISILDTFPCFLPMSSEQADSSSESLGLVLEDSNQQHIWKTGHKILHN